ncbi:hypothetical protein [Mycolicibacterium gilvum]|uniref:Uncharacterized protein n=1 Tax=Mycolicibacterium gilvum (strain DSM 45189 / LMG 24558 / Spyr1) TaxID=278137 RepID=E6TDM7_MYCSR|nr:hypothetical protein [Mycolicibacterium gilvum]ADT97607.1 hypothetical protein Mspyr1_09160 [Mycolicibacterium gilvum Spyr1]
MSRPPDVDRLARSMLLLHGHDDEGHEHGHTPAPAESRPGSWRKAPDFTSDPDRAAAVRASSQADRERYLNSGLASVDCRFCHVSVKVKKLGPAHTSVQWTRDATQRCAHFTEIRDAGGDPARSPSCPRLADSIRHAVAEGCLEEYSSAPSPGDGEPSTSP